MFFWGVFLRCFFKHFFKLFGRDFAMPSCNSKRACKNPKSRKTAKKIYKKPKSRNTPKQTGKTKIPSLGAKWKPVKNSNSKRLSASFYFNHICDGKISRCVPQWILQPDGNEILKKIVIVNGAHGREPRWHRV